METTKNTDPSQHPVEACQSFDSTQIVPINELTLTTSKCSIKACVTRKSPIRTWNNERCKGKLFSMDLSDHNGEITCTAFNMDVDQFYDILEVGKTYTISNFIIKRTSRQFTFINHDYELNLSTKSVIVACSD